MQRRRTLNGRRYDATGSPTSSPTSSRAKVPGMIDHCGRDRGQTSHVRVHATSAHSRRCARSAATSICTIAGGTGVDGHALASAAFQRDARSRRRNDAPEKGVTPVQQGTATASAARRARCRCQSRSWSTRSAARASTPSSSATARAPMPTTYLARAWRRGLRATSRMALDRMPRAHGDRPCVGARDLHARRRRRGGHRDRVSGNKATMNVSGVKSMTGHLRHRGRDGRVCRGQRDPPRPRAADDQRREPRSGGGRAGSSM